MAVIPLFDRLPCMLRHALVGLALAAPGLAAEPSFSRSDKAVRLRLNDAREMSGMAVSPTNGTFLWMVQDSGHPAKLHLATTGGADCGSLLVDGVVNHDWESLSSFVLRGKPYLLIADTGDNQGRRDTCLLHLVPEPELPVPGKALQGVLRPAWSLAFRYEDGPRDCEAVAVDVQAGTILLLSKRTDPPQLYELPLAPSPTVATAIRIGQTSVPQPKRLLPIPYGSQPTGLDISADGSLAAVATYYGVFLFPRAAGESWPTAFARPGIRLAPHRLPQAEAIAFSRDAGVLFVTSEGASPPLVAYQREPAEP